MSFFEELQFALEKEKSRLEIADSFSKIHLNSKAKEYERGQRDRINGKPCASTNGHYLDGWYNDR